MPASYRRRRPAAAAPGAGPSAPPPRRAPSPARRRSAAARRARRPADSASTPVGEDPHGEVAVGDHRHRRARPGRRSPPSRPGGRASGGRPRPALASGVAGDDARGHDLAQLHGAYATAHEHERSAPRVVPLEAGAGPENPPCPACGEPLFGWIDRAAGPGRPGQPLRELRPRRRRRARRAPRRRCASSTGSAPARRVRIANRGGFAAWLGGAGWAGLSRAPATCSRSRRCGAWSPAATRSSAAARWAPGAGIAAMWQTILNGFTFGRNVALGALGRGEAVPAEQPWQRRIDALISVVARDPGAGRRACRWS